MNPERAIAYRKQAGALIDGVLDNSLSARAALNSWPMEGNQDPSVQCAYTILWFFESDQEERHQQELYYADLQVKLLMEVCTQLKQGLALPPNLLHEYKTHLAPSEYEATKATWNMGLVRFVAGLWHTAKTTLASYKK